MKRITILGAVAVTVVMASTAAMPLEGQALRDQFRAVSPSVVVVRTLERTPAPMPAGGFVSAPGLGSGVLVSSDGKVLTAAHVVQTADRVAVEFSDGVIIPARVVASAPRADVALLQLQRVPPGAVVARLADSDSLQVGDDVFIIGAPYGLSRTLTVGHVSGRHDMGRTVGGVTVEVLQTDAAVNMGNSGGPMFSTDGGVVGVVSHILSQSGGFEGVGFAVSSKAARALVLSHQSFWSGADAYLLTGDLAGVFNVPQPAGLLVQRVADASPASEVGLRAGMVRATIAGEPLLIGGDIILTVAGVAVADDAAVFDRIQDTLSRTPPGQTLAVTVLRAGKVVTLTTRAKAR
ncbi:MAG TPA: trypsin-like peptidase domain-containing protein [Gemmatimonadaceae bacterium]|nr:trypsin-like peptidase domain-containing protein [Gemmatimonadaceae bacterium]